VNIPQPLTYKINNFMPEDIRNGLKTGMVVKVHQKIKETNTKGEEKERIQVYEGTVIGVKHGAGASATVTVRKISNGVGVEKIFPIHSPSVALFELVRQMRVHQAKANYLRTYKKRLKEVKGGKVTKVENTITAVESPSASESEILTEEVVKEEVK
jgi:large subunit ribosomal protein L19